MCGGLIVSTARTPTSWTSYHLGRLLGYLSLGAAAGLLGKQVFGTSLESKWISLAAAFILGIGFLAAGVRVWQGNLPHLSILSKSLLVRLYRKAHGSALGTGLITAFLPCGWLHTFVMGAVAMRSAALGAGFLFMFWLGTLPALSAAPWLTRKILRPISIRTPRVAALLLILAGVMSIGAKMLPLFLTDSLAQEQSSSPGHCHFNFP